MSADESGDMAEDPTGDPLELFEVVADETRLATITALHEAWSGDDAQPWLGFEALRERAGVGDSSRFNYHLQRLVEYRFAVKEGPGYRLGPLGWKLVRPVLAGGLDLDASVGPLPVDGECPWCGADLHLHFHWGTLDLECANDHVLAGALERSPALLEERDPDGAVDALAVRLHLRQVLHHRSVCVHCLGHVEGGFRPETEVWNDGDRPDAYLYRGYCQRCRDFVATTPGRLAKALPAVEQFHRERGVAVRERPFWELEWCRPGAAVLEREVPFRLRVDVPCEGDVVSVTFDREGDVVAVDSP